MEVGSSDTMTCLSSTAAPQTHLSVPATSMDFQGPGTSKISSKGMIILFPLAVSCPRQILALPMVLVEPAQRWLLVPAVHL